MPMSRTRSTCMSAFGFSSRALAMACFCVSAVPLARCEFGFLIAKSPWVRCSMKNFCFNLIPLGEWRASRLGFG